MLIVTVDDADFPALESHLENAESVGRIFRDGEVRYVKVSDKFLLCSSYSSPEQIRLMPARGRSEALNLAERLFTEEQEKGFQVEIFRDSAEEVEPLNEL